MPAGWRLARQLTRAAARGVAGPTGSANSRYGSASSPAQAGASLEGRSVLSLRFSLPTSDTAGDSPTGLDHCENRPIKYYFK